jgi:hypothetical protein
MKRVLFVILAVLIVATAGVYTIHVRDLTACAWRKLRRSFQAFSKAHVTMLQALFFVNSPS